jgi:hypothetical protein
MQKLPKFGEINESNRYDTDMGFGKVTVRANDAAGSIIVAARRYQERLDVINSVQFQKAINSVLSEILGDDFEGFPATWRAVGPQQNETFASAWVGIRMYAVIPVLNSNHQYTMDVRHKIPGAIRGRFEILQTNKAKAKYPGIDVKPLPRSKYCIIVDL